MNSPSNNIDGLSFRGDAEGLEGSKSSSSSNKRSGVAAGIG